MDVLNDDDCIVDQDADRKDQREQRDPVDGEAPGPRGEQRGGQGDDDRGADDDRLAPAHRQQDQNHDRCGREQQLLDELLGLVVRRDPVIARHRDLDSRRNRDALQLLDAADDGGGHVDGVGAGLLRDGERHGGRLTHRRDAPLRIRGAGAEPGVAGRRARRIGDRRDIIQIDRLAVAGGHDEAPHIVAVGEELPGLHRHHPTAVEYPVCLAHEVRRLQRGGKVGDGEAGGGEPPGVQFDADHGFAIADRVDVARAGNPFELAHRGACDLAELMGAERGSRLQRVRVTIGTSSMPFGLIRGCRMPTPAGRQS